MTVMATTPPPLIRQGQAGQSGAAREHTSYVGMVIFLGAWAMMFAALFFAYVAVRLNVPSWPPPGTPALPLFWPAVNTAVLLASSVTVHLGLSKIRNWQVAALRRWLLATLGLGALFLALQFKVWLAVWDTGLKMSNSLYGSVFYALTTVHALHVVAGWIAIAAVAVQAYRGVYRKNRHTAVRMVAMFWHFIDVIWVVMFLAVYVL